MDIEYLVNVCIIGIPSPFRLGPLVRVVGSDWTIVICGRSHFPICNHFHNWNGLNKYVKMLNYIKLKSTFQLPSSST